MNRLTTFKKLLSLPLALFLSACTSVGLAAVNNSIVLGDGYTVETATYGSKEFEKIDIYSPPADQKVKGTVVFIYGGRWSEGKKEDYKFVGAYFAKHGFVTAIPDFRKYPEVKFPYFVDDAAKAVAWVDDNIAKGNGIHISGHSSGAHVASLLATDERYLEKFNKKNSIASFAGIAGPYAFNPDEPDLIDIFGPPANYPLMRATTYVDGGEPPMLLLYGEDDDIVGKFNYKKLAAVINETGGSVQIKGYEGLDHIDVVSTFSKLGKNSTLPLDVINFFEAHQK